MELAFQVIYGPLVHTCLHLFEIVARAIYDIQNAHVLG